MGSERPKYVKCIDCGTNFPPKLRGRLPARCPKDTAKYNKKQRDEWLQTGPKPKIRSEKVDVALRTTNMRLAIEQAIPLLNMSLIRPDLANVYIKQAIDHLEIGRGGANGDIKGQNGHL